MSPCPVRPPSRVLTFPQVAARCGPFFFALSPPITASGAGLLSPSLSSTRRRMACERKLSERQPSPQRSRTTQTPRKSCETRCRDTPSVRAMSD